MSQKSKKQTTKRTAGRIILMTLIIVIAAVGTIAVAGWKVIIKFLSVRVAFLETDAPKIEILEASRGVGLAPASFRFKITDTGSGLDEVVARVIQRNSTRELKRERLDGEMGAELPITFRPDKNDLEEGSAELQIRAFDRSFWSNAAEEKIPLKIDFRKPKVEVVTAQHNATEGGSQILFYKAFDEHLSLSGVKAGNHSFLGFPAHGIDESFTDKSLFVVIYAIPKSEDSRELKLKAFAEDEVGNSASVSSFYYKNSPRSYRKVTTKLSDEYLRGYISSLFEQNLPKLQKNAEAVGNKFAIATIAGTAERLIEQFKYVSGPLQSINNDEIVALTQNPRFDRLWEEPFIQQQGTITGAYGDAISYVFNEQQISQASRNGYEFSLPADNREVIAANNGIVMFVENLGVYGRTVGIDHGLGLVSIYGLLENISVKRGETVSKGQTIGMGTIVEPGKSPRVIFEIRVGGVPVDAREWWDRQWIYAHVQGKMNEVKRAFGIPVYRPLE